MPEDGGGANPTFMKFFNIIWGIAEGPGRFVRESIVEPMRSKEKQYYYHRKFRRVPTIDECEVGDAVCFTEANEQYKRDRKVDDEVLILLRHRRIECEHFYGHDKDKFCDKVTKEYIQAEENWYTKYGDLGATGNVLDAYMKQKHRMLWERRNGPVGGGVRATPAQVE